MKHCFLAFDLGATSGRAVLGIFENQRLSLKEIYRFPNSFIELGGKYYWNVYSLYGHLIQALKEAVLTGEKITSLGVDTWGVDFGCIAEDGTILGLPRAYRDPYTVGVPEEVFKTISREELYKITGIQIMNFNTVFQLYAQKKEGHAPLKQASQILFMPDLLSYMLTGKTVCEYTDASTSGIMNQSTRRFEKSLLERLGLNSSILKEPVQPGTIVGTLRKSIASDTGIGEIPVVAVAGHDTASAIAAVPALNQNFAYLSSGTWSLMGIESSSPIINDTSCSFNFTNEGGIEGTTRFLKNITGMWLIERCRYAWKAEGKDYGYDKIVSLAESGLGFSSLIEPDDPRFANPENMPEAIKEYLSDTGQRIPENDGEMLACIFLSLAAKYADVLGKLKEFAPFNIETLHIIGGGSANSLMNQLTANRVGLPVVAGPVEATAIGNIMLQAKTAGLVKDRWEMRKVIAGSVDLKEYKPKNN